MIIKHFIHVYEIMSVSIFKVFIKLKKTLVWTIQMRIIRYCGVTFRGCKRLRDRN